MLSIFTTYSICIAAVMAFMTIAFLVSQRLKRSDVADIAWGLGFIIAALTAFLLQPQKDLSFANVKYIVLLLVTIWGLRLGLHILQRVVSHKEDRRYQELKAKWKKNTTLRIYSSIFLTQGLLLLVISTPVIVLMASEVSMQLSYVVVIGATLWLIGFLFEAIGDWQLRAFLADDKNKGKLMTAGLWRYSRHPNYFGEMLQWWSIFVIGLSGDFGWVGIIGPLTLSFLLLKVSGIPLSEKRYAGRKDWEVYKKRTSMLVPLPPKS